MPTTSIPIPSSVSPITNLKDFIDKGREDMLSFLAGIGGTYIYWTVFPTNDPLTLKQAASISNFTPASHVIRGSRQRITCVVQRITSLNQSGDVLRHIR